MADAIKDLSGAVWELVEALKMVRDNRYAFNELVTWQQEEIVDLIEKYKEK